MRIAPQTFATIPLIIVLTLIAAMAASGSEYCKWTDENGVVHFDENCPENITSDVVSTEGKRTESQKRAAEEKMRTLSEKDPRKYKQKLINFLRSRGFMDSVIYRIINSR